MKTGLALAGGGVSGSAALGVIAALEEANIEITHIAGSSSGSIVAALYAYGYSTDEIKQFMPQFTRKHLDVDWIAILARIFGRRPYIDGWLRGEKLFLLLQKLTNAASVTNFRLPCGIVATDLRSSLPVVFSNVPVPGYSTENTIEIAKAVQASSAIPVIFQPVRWKEYILSDGGVVVNCPIQIVKAMGASHVLAVDTVTAFANENVGELRSAMSIFSHTINLNLKNQMAIEHEHADFSLHPNVGYVGAFDFQKTAQCVEAGYRATWEQMDRIKAILATESQ